MNSEDVLKAIDNSIPDLDKNIWGGDRSFYLSKTDDWYSQYGVITPYVLNNIMVTLIGSDIGVKNVDFKLSTERKEMFFDIYLGFWSYYFNKKKTFFKIKSFLLKQFSDYDLYINLYRFKYNTKDFYNESEKEISRSENKDSNTQRASTSASK